MSASMTALGFRGFDRPNEAAGAVVNKTPEAHRAERDGARPQSRQPDQFSLDPQGVSSGPLLIVRGGTDDVGVTGLGSEGDDGVGEF